MLRARQRERLDRLLVLAFRSSRSATASIRGEAPSQGRLRFLDLDALQGPPQLAASFFPGFPNLIRSDRQVITYSRTSKF